MGSPAFFTNGSGGRDAPCSISFCAGIGSSATQVMRVMKLTGGAPEHTIGFRGAGTLRS